MSLVRNAPAKPAKGSLRAERDERRVKRESHLESEKRHVRKRDGHACRWPRCPYRRARLEVAHVKGQGIGGTPKGELNDRSNLILLCVNHHQYDRSPANPQGSLERNDLAIIPITVAGCEGPVSFWQKDYEDDRLYLVAEETAIRQYRRD